MRFLLRLAVVLAVALPALSATVKVYLNDGTYQLAREYEVKSDRVRYYSEERGDWEEIPLELIDLKKTKAEVERREELQKEQRAADRAEAAAERAAQREAERVPEEAGVYWLNGESLVALKLAESKVNNNRRRSILKALSPLPMIAGKATLEIDGETSAHPVRQERPEFYIRLSQDQRFGIVRLAPAKESKDKQKARVVERWSIVPVTKELIQENDAVEIFRHQVGDGLYKIWAQKPMPAGEYAVIEYTEGKGNTRIWDFTVRPAGAQ